MKTLCMWYQANHIALLKFSPQIQAQMQRKEKKQKQKKDALIPCTAYKHDPCLENISALDCLYTSAGGPDVEEHQSAIGDYNKLVLILRELHLQADRIQLDFRGS